MPTIPIKSAIKRHTLRLFYVILSRLLLNREPIIHPKGKKEVINPG